MGDYFSKTIKFYSHRNEYSLSIGYGNKDNGDRRVSIVEYENNKYEDRARLAFIPPLNLPPLPLSLYLSFSFLLRADRKVA